MKSVYHILDKTPGIYPEEMQVEYEHLAQELVASGRLRIDTDYYCNFVKYYDNKNHINIILSIKELTSDKLLTDTIQSIKALYTAKRKTISDTKIQEIIEFLTKETKKLLPVGDDLSIKLARIFVQSAHPIVIRWILLDKVQVFITYSNNIGDVMNIIDWKQSGKNSGMQSTDGVNACIYVSCGGDPFLENDKDNPTYGNGWAAAARLQIIAAQEIGHFADIKRDAQGNQITRFSANFACTMAVAHVKQARRDDLARCSDLLALLNEKADLYKLIKYERALRFYDIQKSWSVRILPLKLMAWFYRYILLNFAAKNNMLYIRRFKSERYIGLMIETMVDDMKANLAPNADVYKRSDPEAEEAIACVEALARVPQQVMKWGYLTTNATMHGLYNVYYKEVIPSLTSNYEAYTGKRYRRNTNYNHGKISIIKKLLQKTGLIDRKKFRFLPVRIVD